MTKTLGQLIRRLHKIRLLNGGELPITVVAFAADDRQQFYAKEIEMVYVSTDDAGDDSVRVVIRLEEVK